MSGRELDSGAAAGGVPVPDGPTIAEPPFTDARSARREVAGQASATAGTRVTRAQLQRARRRARVHRGRRALGWTFVVAVAVAVGIAILRSSSFSSPSPSPSSSEARSSIPTTTVPVAQSEAVQFLSRYVAADGRVVRLDQGGDTASEGQAYALLLAVAVHDAALFDSVWTWEKDNLQQPSGLFSYLWSDGKVTGSGAATDADLDTAWALLLGASAFGRPVYRTEGLAVASAILANETVVSGGRLELVAGPWARTLPYSVDPSYFSPEAMAALATASGDVRWIELADDSQQLVSDLEDEGPAGSLPPDWASLSVAGVVIAAPAPAGGTSPAYGLDAQRVPVWYAADCTASGRALSAKEWPTISRLSGSGSYLSYSLTGAVQSPYTNKLGLVAAAASADAAGQVDRGRALLAEAQGDGLAHTYYGDAWAALGTVLLTTHLLSPCPPDPTS